MQPRWQGVFPAVTTQMRKDQSLDLEATARHLQALIDSGVDGLVMLGSLGESAALEPEEKRRVLADRERDGSGARARALGSGGDQHRGRHPLRA